MIGKALGDRSLRGVGLAWIFETHRDLDARVAGIGRPKARHDGREELKSPSSQDVGHHHDDGVKDRIRLATKVPSTTPHLAAFSPPPPPPPPALPPPPPPPPPL